MDCEEQVVKPIDNENPQSPHEACFRWESKI